MIEDLYGMGMPFIKIVEGLSCIQASFRHHMPAETAQPGLVLCA